MLSIPLKKESPQLIPLINPGHNKPLFLKERQNYLGLFIAIAKYLMEDPKAKNGSILVQSKNHTNEITIEEKRIILEFDSKLPHSSPLKISQTEKKLATNQPKDAQAQANNLAQKSNNQKLAKNVIPPLSQSPKSDQLSPDREKVRTSFFQEVADEMSVVKMGADGQFYSTNKIDSINNMLKMMNPGNKPQLSPKVDINIDINKKLERINQQYTRKSSERFSENRYKMIAGDANEMIKEDLSYENIDEAPTPEVPRVKPKIRELIVAKSENVTPKGAKIINFVLSETNHPVYYKDPIGSDQIIVGNNQKLIREKVPSETRGYK